MTMHMQIQSPELLRQHQEAVARRARLSGLPAPAAPRVAPAPEPELPVISEAEMLAKGQLFLRASLKSYRDWLLVSDTPEDGRTPSIRKIQSAVSEYYGVTLGDIISARRERNIVHPRMVAVYLSRELTPKSLPEIGRCFGGRNHQTILHSCRKITKLVELSPALAGQIREITLMLRAGA